MANQGADPLSQLSGGESGTWAFLFSDIEGSTQLLLRLGDRYDDVLELHRDIVRQAIARHGGDEQGTEGDSFVVAFRDVTSAVLAAVEAQGALRATKWPEGIDLRVRMGIHIGAARNDPVRGFNGLAVHATARVMTAAHGGQIVVTRPCVDLMAEGVATARPLGSYHLKDLPGPIELFQLAAPGVEDTFPPLRAAALLQTGDRPRVRTPLRGRDRELQSLAARLAEPGAVTLIGPPGTGKTRLAVEALDRVDPTGVSTFFVDLAVVSDADRTLSRVAEVLGIQGENDATESLAVALADRPRVVALDNCEHLIRGVAPLVDFLLQRCPKLTILCTSREALGVSQEEIVAVRPLDTSEEQPTSDALQLFLDRTGAQGVEIPEADWPDVREVVRRLDGIPLAIELAAGLASTLSPREISDRLTSRFRVLGRRGGAAVDRHQTMLAAAEWGYELLSPGEQRALRALSVCAGAFDLGTAEALLGGDDEDPTEPLEHLHRLIRTSWLSRESSGLGSRYRFLETFKAFGEQEAGRAGDIEDHRRRHAEHFLAAAQEIAPRTVGLEQLAAAAQLDEYVEDVWGAIVWSLDGPALLPEAVTTFVALTRYWQTRPDWSEVDRLGSRLLAAVDARPEVVNSAKRSELTSVVALYEFMGGNEDRALELVEQTQLLAAATDDTMARARSARISGMVYGKTNQLERSLECINECIAISETGDVGIFLNLAYLDRAELRTAVEGLEPAIEDLRRALEAATEASDVLGAMMTRTALARVLSAAGRESEALSELIEAEKGLAFTRNPMAGIFLPVQIARYTQSPAEFRETALTVVEGTKRLGRRTSRVDAHKFAAIAALQVADLTDARAHVSEIVQLGGLSVRGGHPVVLLRAAVAHASGDTGAVRDLLMQDLKRMFAGRNRMACVELLWLLSQWNLLEPELNAEAAGVATGLVSTFGLPWEFEVYTGTPRPFDSNVEPRSNADLDALVEEILARTF